MLMYRVPVLWSLMCTRLSCLFSQLLPTVTLLGWGVALFLPHLIGDRSKEQRKKIYSGRSEVGLMGQHPYSWQAPLTQCWHSPWKMESGRGVVEAMGSTSMEGNYYSSLTTLNSCSLTGWMWQSSWPYLPHMVLVRSCLWGEGIKVLCDLKNAVLETLGEYFTLCNQAHSNSQRSHSFQVEWNGLKGSRVLAALPCTQPVVSTPLICLWGQEKQAGTFNVHLELCL